MAKIKLISFLFLLCVASICNCQELNEAAHKKDTIHFVCDMSIYDSIAKDSIRKIYNDQLKTGRIGDGISAKYKFEDLTLKPMPLFRIKRDTVAYSCDMAIENFIQFKESLKYLSVTVQYQSKVLIFVQFPNFSFEMEREQDDILPGTLMDKSNYYSQVLQSFKEAPYTAFEREFFNEREGSFYFGIFGIWGVFEIESETGAVYANIFADWRCTTTKRMPINDFIREYIGEDMVNAIAAGYYIDLDGRDVLRGEPCNTKTKPQNVVVTVDVVE